MNNQVEAGLLLAKPIILNSQLQVLDKNDRELSLSMLANTICYTENDEILPIDRAMDIYKINCSALFFGSEAVICFARKKGYNITPIASLPLYHILDAVKVSTCDALMGYLGKIVLSNNRLKTFDNAPISVISNEYRILQTRVNEFYEYSRQNPELGISFF